jgi:hypothetical protein
MNNPLGWNSAGLAIKGPTKTKPEKSWNGGLRASGGGAV